MTTEQARTGAAPAAPAAPSGLPEGSTDLGAVGTFAEAIGLRFTEVGADAVTAHWEAGPALHQPFGIVHGGVHCTVVETLGSIASALWFGDRGHVVGSRTRPTSTDGVGGVAGLAGDARPPRRTQQVWVVETHDEQGRLVARGQLRTQNLPRRG